MMKRAIVSMLIGAMAHNFARYEAGQVDININSYKADLYDALQGYGLPYKLAHKWIRMAEVKGVQEMEIILNNEELQSHGGSMVTAYVLVEPYLEKLEEVSV